MRSRATAGTATAFLDDKLEHLLVRIRAIQVDGGIAAVTPALRAWEDAYNRLRPHQALAD